jgi:hypothetical protein
MERWPTGPTGLRGVMAEQKKQGVVGIVIAVLILGYFASQLVTRARMPSSQSEFCSAVDAARRQYADASGNEIRQAAAVKQRAARLTRLEVKEWLAEVDEIETSMAKGAFISVTVPCEGRVRLRTWNNMISDVTDHTMIPERSRLYGVLGSLRQGQSVVVSADAITSSDGGPREISVTSAGAMLDPEFLVRFTSIRAR